MRNTITIILLLIAFKKNYAQGYQKLDSLFVFFDTNQCQLSKSNEKIISDFIVKYDEVKELSLFAESFTDERGTIEYNKELSKKRAESILKYVLKLKSDWKERESIGKGIDTIKIQDEQQRRASLVLYRFLKCGTRAEKIYDTIKIDNLRWFKNVTPYYTSKSMIKDSIFAIDVEENLLKTSGMVTFQLTQAGIELENLKDKIVSICIPLKKGEKYDPEMTLWSMQKNEKGQYRWKSISGKIVFDKLNNCYQCFINCGNFPDNNLKGTLGVNLDKSASPNNKIVCFSTYKNYKFTEVLISKGYFSAIIENKYFAFVMDEGLIDPEDTYFTGKFVKNGKEKKFSAKLANCKLAKYKGNDHYYQIKKTNYFINEKEYNKKGFINCVIRLFQKGDNY